MSALLRKVTTTVPSRIGERVTAGLCAAGALLMLFSYGTLSFGLVAFYVALQSGTLHALRVFGYEAPTSVRYATTGLAMGICLWLHLFVRAFHGDSYLEHIGGPPVSTATHGVIVGLNYALVPLASLLHVFRAPDVPPAAPMLLALTELAAIALAHEFVAADQPRQVEGTRLLQLFLASLASVASWVLLLETANRLIK